MSNSIMTPETAPRDLEKLTGQGPFIQRRLGEALNALGFLVWEDERGKSAFLTSSPGDRAQLLLTKLQEMDGGKPAPAAKPATPPPAETPAPGAAPAGAAASTGRQPKTTGAGGGTANGAAAGGNVAELLLALKDVSADLKAVRASLGEDNGNELAQVKSMIAASLKIQEIEVGLLCLFGEQVLGAQMADFIGDAATYGTSALQALDAGKGG